MINKYLKYKKLLRSFLCLSVTIIIIGCFCTPSNFFMGLILIFIGIIFLIITFFIKNKKIMIEEQFKEHCIKCGKNTINITEEKYYVLNVPVTKEVFIQSNNEKIKKIINYYKCDQCHICLTIIKSYLIVNGKEKQLNDKINIDFDYNNNY